jgi:UDP-N-acetylglucosamine:LPS N-acetylglucosamine transferase
MKKVVIFTTGAAGGQASITEALKQTLSPEYTVVAISFFYELLSPLDVAHRNNAEGMYNWIALKKWNWFINTILFNAVVYYYHLREKKIIKIVDAYLQKELPDAIISVVPFINDKILFVAKQRNIPFFLFSADPNPEMYLIRIKNPAYNQFYLGLPFQDESLAPILAKHQIPQSQVLITGYPLRSEFMKPKNRTQLRKKFSIPEHKPAILVLLGSQGTQTLPQIIKQIYKINTSAHILICTGKAEHLKKKIKKIPRPNHISIDLIGYTLEIADLMAASDLFLTKSGSVSVAEALYMNLPMLLDATSEILLWEQFNHYYVQKHNLGNSVQSLEDIADEINALLLDKHYLTLLRNNIAAINKKHGNKTIKEVIDRITCPRPIP